MQSAVLVEQDETIGKTFDRMNQMGAGLVHAPFRLACPGEQSPGFTVLPQQEENQDRPRNQNVDEITDHLPKYVAPLRRGFTPQSAVVIRGVEDHGLNRLAQGE